MMSEVMSTGCELHRARQLAQQREAGAQSVSKLSSWSSCFAIRQEDPCKGQVESLGPSGVTASAMQAQARHCAEEG